MSKFLETALRPFSGRFGPENGSGPSAKASEIYKKMPLAQLIGQVEEMADMGFWRLDLAKGSVMWSPGVFAIHDLPVASEVALDNALAFFPPHHRPVMERALQQVVDNGASYDLELDFISAKGNLKRVRAMGSAEMAGGQITAVFGLFQDITQRYLTDERLRAANLNDELTGLPNGRHLEQFYSDLGLGDPTRKSEAVAFIHISLSDLDQIGARYGRQAQNSVLLTIADRLRERRDVPSFAARLGVDDFALLLRNPGNFERTCELGRQLCQSLHRPITFAGDILTVSIALGFVMREGGGLPYTSMRTEAEIAVRLARQTETATCVISHAGEKTTLDCT